MGVLFFVSWLVRAIPSIVSLPTTQNQVDVDVFLLDLNGVLHDVVSHGPDDLDSARARFFARLAGLFQVVRPRRLVCAALDGVAPRAKLNQQRARRFLAAQERANDDGFDSNALTPGTAAMQLAGAWLEQFLAAHFVATADVPVLVSDASCAGEGEHKLQHFLRQLRSTDVRVCVYGADADLVFLGCLQPTRTVILREYTKRCKRCGTGFHRQYLCTVPKADIAATRNVRPSERFGYEVVELSGLLKYLQVEFGPELPLARVLRDLCVASFVVGNDFVPRNPVLSARDMSLVWGCCRSHLEQHGQFVTDGVRIHTGQLAQLVRRLAAVEQQRIAHMAKKSPEPAPVTDMVAALTLTARPSAVDLFRARWRAKFADYAGAMAAYLRAWQWILLYYQEGPRDWSF